MSLLLRRGSRLGSLSFIVQGHGIAAELSTMPSATTVYNLDQVNYVLEQLDQKAMWWDSALYGALLRACARANALLEGRRVHDHIIGSRIKDDDKFLGNHLVQMYLKCGSMEDAKAVFDRLSYRNVVSWTAMIAAYAQDGHCMEALQLFRQMQLEGVVPDKITYVSVLNACDRSWFLSNGVAIHACIVESGLESDVFVATALVNMYAKCGSLEEALRIFHSMQWRDVVSWNTLIAACIQHGQGQHALALWHKMEAEENVMPNKATVVTILNACSSPGALEEGRLIHAEIVKAGFESDIVVGTALANMYSRCGSLVDACLMFERIHGPDLVSWNAMISTYALHGYCEEAIQVFRQMLLEGVMPDKIILVSILSACGSPAALADGKLIHFCSRECGLESDVVVATALITMYGNCGSLEDAQRMFEGIHARDAISWNALAAAYIQYGHCKEALQMLQRMQADGVVADKNTFVTMLNACTSPEMLDEGKVIHARVLESGFDGDVVVGTALVSMYGNCGRLEDAQLVFEGMHQRDVVSWNTMVAAYAQRSFDAAAIRLFREMQLEGVAADKNTLIGILNACTGPGALKQGQKVHDCATEGGFDADVIVGTALVNMYSKCSTLKDAQAMFDNLERRNLITWNTMLSACVQHGRPDEALNLFHEMQFMPDRVTYVTVLNACACIPALEEGKAIQAEVAKSTSASDTCVATAVVNMYGKCGSLENARWVFEEMLERSLVSWNAMMAGYAQHGHVEEVLNLLPRMQQEGVKPDSISFLSILSACSHAGLIQKARHLFNNMCVDHSIVPTAEHYGCVIDLLGRMGRVAEAEGIINQMPIQADIVAWKSLLSACRVHGNEEGGKRAAEHVLKLDPGNTAAYVMLSNIHAEIPGCSKVEKRNGG